MDGRTYNYFLTKYIVCSLCITIYFYWFGKFGRSLSRHVIQFIYLRLLLKISNIDYAETFAFLSKYTCNSGKTWALVVSQCEMGSQEEPIDAADEFLKVQKDYIKI